MVHICKSCHFATTTKNIFNSHLLSKKHKQKHPNETAPPFVTDGSANIIYECSACDFSTFIKSAYTKHETTKRHVELKKKQGQPIEPGTQSVQNTENRETNTENTKTETKKEKYHLGALRLLQELSAGKITENDITEYMKRNSFIDESDVISTDSDNDDNKTNNDDDDTESDTEKDSNENITLNGNINMTGDDNESITISFNEPAPTPHTRHQPYYHSFPPVMPDGKLPEITGYKMPSFIENRHKKTDPEDPEIEAQQFNDIRTFIIDFLNGTQNRLGPDVEKYRWQLNEITKLFIHNNIRSVENRPSFTGII